MSAAAHVTRLLKSVRCATFTVIFEGARQDGGEADLPTSVESQQVRLELDASAASIAGAVRAGLASVGDEAIRALAFARIRLAPARL